MDVLLVTVAVVNPSQAYLATVCAILGSLAGSSILFAIARKGGEVLLTRYVSHGRGKRFHDWFERYGLVTVFVPAVSPLPLPMKIPVFCSGALEVRWSYFVAVVLLARAVRYFSLASLGARFGTETFVYLKTHATFVALLVGGFAFLSVLLLRLLDKTQSRSVDEIEAGL